MVFSDQNKISKKKHKAGQRPKTGRWFLLEYSLRTKNKLHNRQIEKCQLWYKWTLKRFVEIIYSIEAVKTKLFFISLNERSPKRSNFEMSELFLLKIFSSILWSLLILFEKLDETLRIVTVKETFCGRPYESQYAFLEKRQTQNFLYWNLCCPIQL